MEDYCEDSGSVSESTMEDSVTEDISPNGIARGIERLDEENQQHMIENSNSKDDRGQMRGPSRLSETAEEFELPQIPLRTAQTISHCQRNLSARNPTSTLQHHHSHTLLRLRRGAQSAAKCFACYEYLKGI
jgi:hypothetical protein